jgi:L-asparaginase
VHHISTNFRHMSVNLFEYRASRSSKVSTSELRAFDSPNIPPLATVGITINENSHLFLPEARGVLRVHTKMDTRLLALRMVPGFDDQVRFLPYFRLI